MESDRKREKEGNKKETKWEKRKKRKIKVGKSD